MVGTPFFLSYPKPGYDNQQAFITRVSEYFTDQGFEPRTLGVTDYDMTAPLRTVRRLLHESNGFVGVALRRTHIADGRRVARGADGVLHETGMRDAWLTTPWPHIEAAMAYQIGLPILIFRESGLVADGILEPGVAGLHMPEIDLDADLDTYFQSPQWRQPVKQWKRRVQQVIERKGHPPALYDE